MKLVLISLLILLIIVFSIQYYGYQKISNGIEIEQNNYRKLINSKTKIQNNNLPLIITDFPIIEPYKQLKKIGVISPLSIYENLYDYSIDDNTTYYSHNYEVLALMTNKVIEVELINPMYKKKFDYLDRYDSIYQWSLNDLNQNEIKSVGIKLYPNQILIIPRFWLYKVETTDENPNIKLQVSHSIFSYLFSFLRR
jgi:hypothetical protein